MTKTLKQRVETLENAVIDCMDVIEKQAAVIQSILSHLKILNKQDEIYKGKS